MIFLTYTSAESATPDILKRTLSAVVKEVSECCGCETVFELSSAGFRADAADSGMSGKLAAETLAEDLPDISSSL